MKKLFMFIVFILLLSQVSYAADSTAYKTRYAGDKPFNVEGDRFLFLPDSVLPSGMSGMVVMDIIISEEAQVLDCRMTIVDISDSSKSNFIRFKKLDNSPFYRNAERTSKYAYPQYARDLYDEVVKVIHKLKITKDEGIQAVAPVKYSLAFSINKKFPNACAIE